jgi:hypothetical protein
MSAKITADATGTKVTIGTAAEDALQIDTVAKTIKALGSYNMLNGGPCFRAVGDSNITVGVGATVKLSPGSTTFNIGSGWASGKFQPTIAGYYLVTFNLSLVSQTAAYQFIGSIYKNGVEYETLRVGNLANTQLRGSLSSLVYLNGTTDYIEFYASHNHNSSSTVPSGYPIVGAAFLRPAP